MSKALLRLGLAWCFVWQAIALELSEPATAQPPVLKTPASNRESVVESDTASPEPRLNQIRDIQIKPQPQALQIQMSAVQSLVAVSTTSGVAQVITFNNAVLTLPNSSFQRQTPIPGIAEVVATQITPTQVELRITGITQAPSARLEETQGGMLLIITPPQNVSSSDESIEITVTAEQNDERYLIPEVSSITRVDTPIKDIPQSIQVIPQEILENQQVVSLEDALQNLSGVVGGNKNLGREQSVSIRGFRNAPILRNGLRQFGAGGTFPETANLEQVEILRGPASILYGDVSPGGVVNLVTKQPLPDPTYELKAQFGNAGLIRPSLDLSGPLTSDGSLLYRLNALYQRGGDFQETNLTQERFFIAPVLQWKISEQTEISFDLEFLDETRPPAFGIPAIGSSIADIPFDRITNEPDDRATEQSIGVGYRFEHRFSEDWKVRNQFRYTHQNAQLDVAFPFALDESTGIMTRFWASQPQEAENFSLQTDVTGQFSTGPIEHKLLIGFDLNHEQNNFNTLTRLDPFTELPLDIFNPIYGRFPRPNFERLPLLSDQEVTTKRLGIFFQDQLKLLDNLTLVAGARFDAVEQTLVTQATDFGPSPGQTQQQENAITPRVGLVYQPIPAISLYGSYSESFSPNDTEVTTADGSLLPFERGRGFEVGLKGDIIEDTLSATVAFFDITRQNVASADPNNPFFSIATGEQRSRGVELDLVGQILPGWDILASYAYLDAEITQDATFDEGNRLPSAPRHSANLWTTYAIQSGTLEGLSFGLGFNFVGDRAGDLANSFTVDSYFLTNAAIAYGRDNWKLALNFRNVFDVDYIADTGTRERGNDPGNPFTVVGSVSVKF